MLWMAPPGKASRDSHRVAMYWSMVRLGSSAKRACEPRRVQAQSASVWGVSRQIREPLNHDLHRMLQLEGRVAVDVKHDTDGFDARRRHTARECVFRGEGCPPQGA